LGWRDLSIGYQLVYSAMVLLFNIRQLRPLCALLYFLDERVYIAGRLVAILGLVGDFGSFVEDERGFPAVRILVFKDDLLL
jgi:hypothetical protein